MLPPSLFSTPNQLIFQNSSNSLCSENSDNVWGPFHDCRFDFTLIFEQGVLSAIPALIFLVIAVWRICYLWTQNEKTRPSPLRVAKVIVSIALTLVQFTILVLWIVVSVTTSKTAVPTAAINLLMLILLSPLSYLEDKHSIRPSSVLNVYLLFSTLLELPQARTLYLLGDNYILAGLFLVYLGLKVVLLVVEAQNKRTYLKPEYQQLPPEVTSGIINRSFYWWVNELFKKGSRGLINFEDLYALDPKLGGHAVGSSMRNSWAQRSQPEGQFSLAFATWRTLRGQFAYAILPRLFLVAFSFTQPFLIRAVLELLGKTDSERTRDEGYSLVIATAIVYIGIAISSLHNSYSLFRFTTMFRSGMIALIYEKTLTLKDGAYDEAAVSLMSSDVDGISGALEELNEIWSRIIEIAIGLPLLTQQLGWVSIVPIIVVIIPFYGAAVISRLIASRQKLWGDATQKRLGTTASMLRDMSSLKMMALTDVVGETVQNERVAETKRMEGWAWIKVWQNVIANVPDVLAPAATFAVYAIQAHIQGSESLNTVQAFTSLALIFLISYPTTILLTSIPNAASSIGCFDRVQDFLLSESRIDGRGDLMSSRLNDGPLISISEDSDDLAVSFTDVSIRPAPTAEVVLSQVNLKIHARKIVMVTGPVGVGKTTLLKAILGEIMCDSGVVSVQTRRIAYCSQSPWLQSGTIRQSILGIAEDKLVDETWYSTVLDACALTHDLAKFPAYDRTLIGSRGITLSGGQRHRVALARALYSRAEIFVLDDILSALDKRTEKSVAEKLFGSEGLFQKIGSTVIMVTHATQYLPLAHQVIVIPGNGQKVHQGEYKKIEQAGLIEDLPVDDAASDTSEDEIKVEELETIVSEATENDEARDLQRRTGDISVYSYYFKSIGLVPILLSTLFVLSDAIFVGSSKVWLKWWTDVDGSNPGFYATVYILLGFGGVAAIGGYNWSFVILIAGSTGRKLHRVLLQTVLRAPLSFFAQTETGSILSRFSQDMTLIERQLSTGFLITTTNLCCAITAAVLLASGSPLVSLTAPVFVIFVYQLQKVYLCTSRQLRYLDLESRSPLYSHFLETLEGLTTIRAFGWEDNFNETNIQRLDDSQKPYYLLFCVEKWLSIVLDLMSAAVATLVVGMAISFKQWTDVGLLGVSMNSVLDFNAGLSQFINGWTMFETSLGAVSRLKNFEKDTPIEAQEGKDCDPPSGWPLKGLIEIKDVSVHYSTSTTPALQNIDLTIQPGQKVGICGRTGSGKSTLLSTLLRTIDLSSGSILIDSISMSSLPRTTIRQSITVVPQSPIHLSGTLRQNVDPFHLHSSSSLITALQKVQLWSVLTERGGLDAELLPDSLSKGQGQLLALARAILQKNNIVILDEATSSVDAETDRIMKEVIREAFRECTVITVAHRPETILDSDVIVLLEGGKIVEVGEPGSLMGEDSKLKALLGTL